MPPHPIAPSADAAGHSRRTFLERSLAVGAGFLVPVGVTGAAAAAKRRKVNLPGPSGSDDTGRLRSALARAPAGALVLARPGATYHLSNTLRIAKKGLILDLQGATLAQVNPRKTMAAVDAVLDLAADGITVRNGSIVSKSPYRNRSLVAGKIRIVRAAKCVVANLSIRHHGHRSTGVFAYFAPGAVIRNVRVIGASIGGLGCNAIVIDTCRIGPTAPGVNGIALVAYQGYPLNDIVIRNNRVFRHGRWGIEVTLDSSSGATQQDIARPILIANRIEAPQPGAVNGAMSCLGYRGKITDNVIIDPLGWGIEIASLENRVLRNRVTRSRSARSGDPGYGIVVDGHDATGAIGPATVAHNSVSLANYAVYGANNPGAVVVRANTIVDALRAGILIDSAGPGAAATGNRLHFTRPGLAGMRYGIAYPRGSTVTGNQLKYDAASRSAQTTEQPLSGPADATVDDNTITRAS